MRLITIFFTLLMFGSFTSLKAQSVFDREVGLIAEAFRDAADLQLSGQNIAIGDFLDEEGKPVRLGKILADELTFALRGSAGAFTIVDRTYFQKLMDEVNLGTTGLLDDNSVRRLGNMAGISVVVYGNIYRQYNNYVVYLKYAHLEKQIVDPLTKGYLSRVPSVDAMYTRVLGEASESTSTQTNKKKVDTGKNEPFMAGSLQIKFLGCAPNGSALDCRYELTSMGRNESVILYQAGSYLTGGGRRASPTTIYLGSKRSSYQLSTALRSNQPVITTIRYMGFSGTSSNANSLNLHIKTPSTFDVNYLIQNVRF